MKKTIAFAILMGMSAATIADTYVDGYVRSDGTYVQPHYRSSPNNTTLDNYSTRGNTNPYTGQPGYKDPYGSGYSAPSYGGGNNGWLNNNQSNDSWLGR